MLNIAELNIILSTCLYSLIPLFFCCSLTLPLSSPYCFLSSSSSLKTICIFIIPDCITQSKVFGLGMLYISSAYTLCPWLANQNVIRKLNLRRIFQDLSRVLSLLSGICNYIQLKNMLFLCLSSEDWCEAKVNILVNKFMKFNLHYIVFAKICAVSVTN